MLFFSITMKPTGTAKPLSDDGSQDLCTLTQRCSEAFFFKQERSVYFFVESITEESIFLGAVIRSDRHSDSGIEDMALAYVASLGREGTSVLITEITFSMFRSMLRRALRDSYDDVLDMLMLGQLGYVDFPEYMVDVAHSKEELLSMSADLLSEASLGAEIERIYKGSKSKVRRGHPVHYVVTVDDKIMQRKIIEFLISALYCNGRIQSRRYSLLHASKDNHSSLTGYTNLYPASVGGTIVVDCDESDKTATSLSPIDCDALSYLCDLARQYKHEVLTVFILPRSLCSIQDFTSKQLYTLKIVELGENLVFGKEAQAYLQRLARKMGVHPDEQLYANPGGLEKGLYASELIQLFDNWFSRRLCDTVYPQYSGIEIASCSRITETGAKGSAISELMSLIGLVEAKEMIREVLDFHKINELMKHRGMNSQFIGMHMVFAGNPGTAKTTAARLFAQIMKDNGVLPVGNLIEVGRADLVGRYVGWTAPKVREQFRRAKGSVLFIDEAYSLMDGKEGLFGSEAVNTIVMEMERQREDVVVIFAGYPNEMERFLCSNPGLKSRITFQIPFPDYSEQELFSILDWVARSEQMQLGTCVQNKVMSILEEFICEKDFGNGRFMRKLFEKARLRQAGRLLAMKPESISDTYIRTLIASDFVSPSTIDRQKQAIGF